MIVSAPLAETRYVASSLSPGSEVLAYGASGGGGCDVWTQRLSPSDALAREPRQLTKQGGGVSWDIYIVDEAEEP